MRILSHDIGMEFGIEKSAILEMKSDKRHPTDRMELPNQDKMRNLGVKETNKYLGILKADAFKQVEIKEKSKKDSQEPESYSRQNHAAETLSKE